MAAEPWLNPVTRLRVIILVTILVIWEAVAASGILLREVVPSIVVIGRSLAELLFHPDLKWPVDIGIGGLRFAQQLWVPAFYWHLYVTVMEVATALVIGGSAGLAVGLALGANPFLSKAFERYLYYLGPTPKIVFFPVMIMWFGVGPESKIAMGTLSCFFPIVLSVAAGMRQIEGVLIRVGRSFRLNTWQMVTKIYLPAMREPIVNGVRLGMGVAMIGTLLAETKLSNKGVGFMIIDAYNTFDMPRMYAVLLTLFVVAIGANALVGRASRG
ncbi:MAG: ABC transporter permease subunit [Xanthobacteraceae bacterium]|nr:ABC transporter permease subunit [Xanthobacteraceae bacterium]